MATLPLTLATGAYDHVRDLRPRGIALNQITLPIEEIFYRFTRFREWDAAEMSFGKVAALMADPEPQIIALPVFVSRVFRHSAIYVRKGAGIGAPKDLEGRRVGVPEWAQTATIYVRGMLAHEYGVDLRSIAWTQAGVREPGRIEKVKLHLPAGLRVTPAPDRSLADMLAKGDLDAVISARDPGGERLFPDYPAQELAYFRKTRIFPIMHVVVLRRDVYQRDRWAAMNLMQALEEAKDRGVARAAEIGASSTPVPWVADHARRWREVAGADFWPYGIEPNRPTLEAFLQYAHEQGVCARRLQVEELFAPETLQRAKI
ncbi:MAG TPA: 4,5-dihydroxyphthalate decarboxylase [Burkholderiales bacterium]